VFIAILDFRTDATDRPAALAQFDEEGNRVRAMPGNIAFRVYAAREMTCIGRSRSVG
jgi:quinol monooxygenase YgiN